MEPLKVKIPKIVNKGDVFTLSSGEYEENETDCVMQASKAFNLNEVVIKWQNENTKPNNVNLLYLENDKLELKDGGVDLVQYLQKESIAITLPFFNLDDDCTYNNDFTGQVNHHNDYI